MLRVRATPRARKRVSASASRVRASVISLVTSEACCETVTNRWFVCWPVICSLSLHQMPRS